MPLGGMLKLPGSDTAAFAASSTPTTRSLGFSISPTALTPAEITALVEQAIASSGASSARDMGKVMALLKPELQGRADIGAVSAQVKTRLG